jgi:fatty acid desaturase
MLALAHAAVLVAWPSMPLIALGLWWNSNTIAHNAIHRPLFARPRTNRHFALLETGLLGFPFEVWRQRHLAHHAARGSAGVHGGPQ